GDRTWLDKQISEQWKTFENHHFYLSLPDEYIVKQKYSYVTVLDDYIITVKMDPETQDTINTIFTDQIKTQEQCTLEHIMPILQRTTKIKMKLQKHRQKASYYYQRFEQFFGPIRKKHDIDLF